MKGGNIMAKKKKKKPQNSWLRDALLIPEGRPYKIDSSSRIIVPAHLKDKFGIKNDDRMDYYTTFVDDKWFICVTKHEEEEEEDDDDETEEVEDGEDSVEE